jgi:hypothetical protein
MLLLLPLESLPDRIFRLRELRSVGVPAWESEGGREAGVGVGVGAELGAGG